MSEHDDASVLIQQSATPRSSYSSSSISPSSSSGSHASAKSAVSECLGAWLNYLQILNNLCASGHRLAQSISAMQQTNDSQMHINLMQQQMPPPQPPQVTTQFITAWDDLARATAVATSTVKSHIVSVLQDFVIQSQAADQESFDCQRIKEHNQQIVMETAQTMINIQHQFCVASYDSFSTLMCCFVCQAPVGFPHDSECAMINQQQTRNQTTQMDPRSQTPSPHLGTISMNIAGGSAAAAAAAAAAGIGMHKGDRDIYRMPSADTRGVLYGSATSTQASSEHICAMPGGMAMDTRGPSPHHEIRGPSPIQGFLENIRGPLPNPGQLLGMKTPFYRGSRSPLNFPLFPLNGQRRWSEAAAGEVKGECTIDESNMRRWSMPWEASKAVKNTVTWHQTRITPVSKFTSSLASKASSDRSQNTTPDSIWNLSATSQDGLAEAIQLLSCRPMRMYQPPPAPPPLGPLEESNAASNMGTYEMWSDRTQERLPCIKFNRKDDNK